MSGFFWRGSLCCAIFVFSLIPSYAAEPGTVEAVGTAIDVCVARLDAQLDVGYERIAARCPDLARKLEDSDFAQWLPQGWKESRNNLSAGSLTELRALVAREEATRATARTPSVEHLKRVLEDLGDRHAQVNGAWARFKRWLRELMQNQDRSARESWFDRMVSRSGVSDAIVEITTYVALGLIVVLALVVVVNELRAAGALTRRRRKVAGTNPGRFPSTQVPLTLEEIERAPPVERPGMLLDMVARRLTALRRLPPASALTARELARAVEWRDPQDRDRLEELALTAERARYAEGELPSAVLETASAHGRELLNRVQSLGVAEPSGGAG